MARPRIADYAGIMNSCLLNRGSCFPERISRFPSPSSLSLSLSHLSSFSTRATPLATRFLSLTFRNIQFLEEVYGVEHEKIARYILKTSSEW